MNDNGNGKPKMGAPFALDDAKKDQIVAFVSGGGSENKAAAFVGCSQPTIMEEKNRDPAFSCRLAQARAGNYKKLVRRQMKAALGSERNGIPADLDVGRWCLTHLYPEEFNPVHKVAQTDAAGNDLTAEQRQQHVEAILHERFGVDAALTEGSDRDGNGHHKGNGKGGPGSGDGCPAS